MASVYVGTYKKYNNGSIKGAWLNLADYATYKDFVSACRDTHKDERDPEFMIQDSENFPDGLDCGEWISEEEFNCVKLAMREEQQEAGGKPAINIIAYSERAFAVVGDTKAVKDALKRLGGSFNPRLSCGAGWVFPEKKRAEVAAFIESGEVSAAVKAERSATPAGGQKFVEWLAEYVASGKCDDYARKNAVGAIKLQDGYYLIKKPSIETKFCFHDEGPEYEFYKTLCADNSKMAAYFKAENLDEFDSKITRITEGDTYIHDKRVWLYDRRNNEKGLNFYRPNDYNTNERECTEDEKALILQGMKFGRACFEKRLDAYLHRYGVNKLHTWSYWADA